MRDTPLHCALIGIVAGTVGWASCATEAPLIVGPEPRVVWSDARDTGPAPKAAPMSDDEARSIALAHDAGHTCEITARALRSKDRQRGWAVMRQCVLRPDYSDLESLVVPPWSEDLGDDKRAFELIGHVIAVRGGDVQNDLRVCRRSKLPVFSLRAAVTDPEQYAGRIVVMRGTARDGRSRGGSRALRVVETKVMAESEWVPHGARLSSRSATDTRDSNTSGQGFHERTARDESNQLEVLHNVSVETGLEVFAAADGDSAFLEPGSDYVLVLRFDGMKESFDGGGTVVKPSATVLAYFEPELGLFARLR